MATRLSKQPPPGSTTVTISLVPQTGMPPVYQSRSRELKYDALQNETDFIYDPFGPRKLYLSRPKYHW
jgi:hypothetical protein